MSDRFSNRGRKPAPGHGQPIPERATADKFELELKENELSTTTGSVPQRKKSPNTSTGTLYYTEKERRRQEKEHRKRNRIKAGKNKRVFSLVWIVMVLLISFTMASILIAGSNDFLGVDRVDSITDITIPEHVTIDQLSQILSEHGVINNKLFFGIYCNLTAETKIASIAAGNYAIETNLDYENIISFLRSGDADREVIRITFPEGMNALDIAVLLEENDVCDQDEALDAMNEAIYGQYAVVNNLKNETLRYYKLEGYLFPDTYDFYKEEGPSAIYRKMLSNCETRLDIVGDRIMQSAMSLDEIMTLASIIQREAANVNDMYMVSAVLHNRLKESTDSPMAKLECDSTIFYPYHTRNDLPPEQLNYNSSYNTYDVVGLPNGPICNPGLDAIKAALQPSLDGAEYFYFCHAEDGTAYYAKTLEEHNLNLVAAGLTDAPAAEAPPVA